MELIHAQRAWREGLATKPEWPKVYAFVVWGHVRVTVVARKHAGDTYFVATCGGTKFEGYGTRMAYSHEEGFPLTGWDHIALGLARRTVKAMPPELPGRAYVRDHLHEWISAKERIELKYRCFDTGNWVCDVNPWDLEARKVKLTTLKLRGSIGKDKGEAWLR